MGKWDAAVKEAEKRWACGELTERDDDGKPMAHCALGIIGHVNMGDKFDTPQVDGYEQLRNHPKARRMVARLVNTLMKTNPEVSEQAIENCGYLLPGEKGDGGFFLNERFNPKDPGHRQEFIIQVNDTFGQEHIVAALKEIRKQERRKVRKAKATRLKNEMLAKMRKSAQPRVEYVTADNKEVLTPVKHGVT